MLKGSDGWFNVFLTFIFYSAVRTSEVMGLQWNDIDFLNNKITISRSIRQGRPSTTKTGTVRTIDIAEALYASRVSYTSLMLEAQAPMSYIQAQLGHANISTTMTYYLKNGLVNNGNKDERLDTLYA